MFKKKKIKKDLPLLLKSRDMGAGKFEVNGVVFYCDSHAEALRKYRRGESEKYL